jgi:ABC-type transport system involved in cytochrome bd biosynthesis fused ATPase/permease subunit
VKKQLQRASQTPPARGYVRALAREPVAWGSALVVAIAGAAAGAIAVAPAVLALTAATCVVARQPAVRRYVDARQRRERARQRRDELEARLEDAGVDPEELASLARLAELVAQYDPERAEALELERLLERYADAAVALARCRGVVAAVDVGRLQRLRAVLDGRSPRAALIARQLAFRSECEARGCVLEEALVAIHELFVLAAQQAVAGPGVPGEAGEVGEVEDAIAARLAYLDAADDEP